MLEKRDKKKGGGTSRAIGANVGREIGKENTAGLWHYGLDGTRCFSFMKKGAVIVKTTYV